MILPKTKEIVDYLKLKKKLWVLQYAKDIHKMALYTPKALLHNIN